MEPLKPKHLIGRTKAEALGIIKTYKLEPRITFEDDKYFIGTDEININRVNLEIKGGVVVNAAFG